MIARLFTGEHGRAVTLGVVGVGLLLLVQFVFLPLGRAVLDSEKRIHSAQKALARAERLAREYSLLRSTVPVAGSDGVDEQTSLFARMEAAARRLGLTPMVESMRPENKKLPDGTAMRQVHVRMRGLGMQELLEYLHACEASVGGRIRNLGLRRNQEQLLDVELVVSGREGL